MRLNRIKTTLWFVFISFAVSGTVSAHFGMVIPSDTMVTQEDVRNLTVTLSFSHPMEMVGMDMAKPRLFAVSSNGKKEDLLSNLKPVKVMGHSAWETVYAIKQEGVDKDVELGAVIWVYFHDWKQKGQN